MTPNTDGRRPFIRPITTDPYVPCSMQWQKATPGLQKAIVNYAKQRKVKKRILNDLGLDKIIHDGNPIWPRERNFHIVHFMACDGEYFRRFVIFNRARDRSLDITKPLCDVGEEVRCASWMGRIERCDACIHQHSTANLSCGANITSVGKELQETRLYFWRRDSEGKPIPIPGVYESVEEESRGKSPIIIFTYKRLR